MNKQLELFNHYEKKREEFEEAAVQLLSAAVHAPRPPDHETRLSKKEQKREDFKIYDNK